MKIRNSQYGTYQQYYPYFAQATGSPQLPQQQAYTRPGSYQQFQQMNQAGVPTTYDSGMYQAQGQQQSGYQQYGGSSYVNPFNFNWFMPTGIGSGYYNPRYGMGFLGGGTFNNRNYASPSFPRQMMYSSPSNYGRRS